MSKLLIFLFAFISFSAPAQQYVILLHGGAGNSIRPENINEEEREAYAAKMKEALDSGKAVLERGEGALLAVTAVITTLEDSPLFNAGRGAVYTWEGRNEMDASVMDGKTLAAGAVAGVRTVKNPVLAAHEVMKNSPHVLLSGAGADEFARLRGLELADSAYFGTERSLKGLQKYKARHGSIADSVERNFKMGTVGCVVLDKEGNLAAGTSTGGMTGKRYGRIGDSPLIGAGTYADNESCAVSCTGHGEYFIRHGVAYDMHARMKYLGEKVDEAAAAIIGGTLKAVGGSGGLIAVDKEGNIAVEFNTSGMFRAWIREGQAPVVEMF